MNTTTAATQAGVTVATIRTWCRIGAVAAAKVAGKWVIEAGSLARRIALGVRKTTPKPAAPAGPVWVEMDLDVCTPEGKTWLARVTGLGGRFGIEREFVNTIARDTSRSGRTGTYTYMICDGVYESNEGRRRYGRRYWLVKAGVITEIDRSDLAANI
jgi:hypothetical protein